MSEQLTGLVVSVGELSTRQSVLEQSTVREDLILDDDARKDLPLDVSYTAWNAKVHS